MPLVKLLKAAAATGALVCAALTAQTPASEADTAQPGTQESLSVMAWNVDLLPDVIDTLAGLRAASRVPRIASVVLHHSSDVVVLDEIFNHTATARLLSSLSSTYPYHTPVVGQSCSPSAGWAGVAGRCSTSPLITNGGTMIFSKYPIVTQYELVYDNSASWDWWTNKGAALALINKNGHQSWVVGTHLQANQASASSAMTHRIRIQQLSQLRTWVNDVAGAGAPVLLGGDLNITYYGSLGRPPSSNEYLQAEEAADAVLRTSAQGTQPVTTMDCPVSSWCQEMARFESFPKNTQDDLDYLGYLPYHSPYGYNRQIPLSDPSVASLIDPQTGWTPAGLDTYAPSDHYPVESDFELP